MVVKGLGCPLGEDTSFLNESGGEESHSLKSQKKERSRIMHSWQSQPVIVPMMPSTIGFTDFLLSETARF